MTSSALPTVSVVVPTHNRVTGLPRVLEPLLATDEAHEVIVVVDGSRDGSYELLRARGRGNGRLLPIWIENSGEMTARQVGAERARGEVVLFLDDDVIAEPGLVRGHAERHAGSDRRVVVGYMPIQLPLDRGPGEMATRLYTAEYEGRCRALERDAAEVLPHLWAGNFSMRRETCLEVGLRSPAFDERYHPDRELGLRLQRAGLHGVFDRRLRAQHLHFRSLDEFRRDARSQGAARVQIARLHPDAAAFNLEELWRDVPSPARALLRGARRRLPRRAVASALAGVVRAAGTLRLWSLETLGGKLLRRLEQVDGALTASRPRTRGRGRRPPVSFIAWTSVSGRAHEMAAALSGDARVFWSSRLVARPLVPLRWAASAGRTVLYLLRRRPRSVIVTAPPIWPSLIGLAYARATRGRVLIDSHPTAFGMKDHRASRVLLPLHRWIARRARSNLVPSEGLARQARGWGANATVIHEAPPQWAAVRPAGSPGPRPRVLFVGIFASDEPVADVVDAARRRPGLDIFITGDLRRCPPGLRESAPANVHFTGFLREEDYRDALERADIVVALTTEPTSVVRAGFEAVYAGRPLVVSDWPELRESFPHAVHAGDGATGIAAAVNDAIERHAELLRAAPAALAHTRGCWARQLAELRQLLEL